MVMFGSSYPHWQCGDIHKLPGSLTAEQRDKLCWRNAADLYGIDIAVGSGAQ
jgi:predicted TIM-barrel fold metal-dependent hydrolase